MDFSEYKKIEYFKKVYKNIHTKGFHTTAVLENINFTPFTYSTGIYENFKIPELFISGLGPNLSSQLIENYIELYKYKGVPLNTKIETLTDRFPIYLIEVDNENLNDYVLTSFKYYEKRKFKYLQLIFPDLNLRFPNENGYEYDQEILGKFEI